MSGRVSLQYPLSSYKGRTISKFKGRMLSGAAHVGVFLGLVITVAAGSGLTVAKAPGIGRGATTFPDRHASVGQSASPSARAETGSETRTAPPEIQANPGRLGREHLLKDVVFVAICFLAASLWWFARSPARPRTDKPGTHPLVIVPSPWNAEEQERKQISRDLHDCVGQVLTATGLELATLRSSTLTPEQMREHLDSVSQLNAEALRLVRDLAIGLRPAVLDDVGLTAALQWQGRQFARRTAIAAVVECSGDVDALPEAQRSCIYRCVQEALTNCAKHSKAANVRIQISALSDAVTFTIEDDGVGIKTASMSSPGVGILGMHERVEAVGGRLNIESRPQGGTRLRFEIPIGVEAHA